MSDDREAARRQNGSTSGVADLWDDVQGRGSIDARDRLILHYAPLVKYVAGRVAVGLPQNIEQADLVSYGMFGLIDAIDKFDLSRGFKFETYAIARIKGRDHRRAAVDRLGAPLGAGQGPSGREGLRQARGTSSTAPRPTPRWPAEMGISEGELQTTVQPDLVRRHRGPRRDAVGGAVERGESTRSATPSPTRARVRSAAFEVEEMKPDPGRGHQPPAASGRRSS